MSQQLKTQFQGGSGKLLGALLIALGVLFFLGQLFRIDVGHWGWPFFILVPGAALFALGMASDNHVSHPLIILGSVTTAVGVLLFYQNMVDHWESWAYAWALIAPTAIGIGEMIYGSVKGHAEAVTTGTRLVTIGLIIFAVGAVFFELVIGIGGFGLGGWVWAILLIGLGAYLLLRNAMGGTHKA
jgi:hypothetical protein